jgi:hypothetical protein
MLLVSRTSLAISSRKTASSIIAAVNSIKKQNGTRRWYCSDETLGTAMILLLVFSQGRERVTGRCNPSNQSLMPRTSKSKTSPFSVPATILLARAEIATDHTGAGTLRNAAHSPLSGPRLNIKRL